MKKFLLMSAACIALSAPAFAATDVTANTKVETNVTNKADGSYKEERSSTSTSKDTAGTETRENTNVKVETDADGNVKKIVKKVNVVDPKGLLNESKTEVTDKEEIKDGKRTTEHLRKVDGKTTVDVKEENKTDVH